jgi:metal-sulfur cluster biosynthetic enzyme
LAPFCGLQFSAYFHFLMATNDDILAALKAVIDPNTGKDFVSTKSVKNLTVSEGDVAFDVELGYPAKSQIPGFRKALIAAAKGVPGVENVSCNVTIKITAHAAQRGVALMPTSLQWPRAKVGWAKAPPPSTWPWPWPLRVPR